MPYHFYTDWNCFSMNHLPADTLDGKQFFSVWPRPSQRRQDLVLISIKYYLGPASN